MMDKTVTTAPPLPWAVQLSQGKPKPAATVAPAPGADTARQNDGRPPQDDRATAALALAPPELPDPNTPTGPPPAFKANVLDAERARLRRPEPMTPARGAAPPSPYAIPAQASAANTFDLAL